MNVVKRGVFPKGRAFLPCEGRRDHKRCYPNGCPYSGGCRGGLLRKERPPAASGGGGSGRRRIYVEKGAAADSPRPFSSAVPGR